MDIHNRLNELLKQSGTSRYRLAKICDIPQETLTGIFKRGNTPTFSTLEIICKGLGITLAEFFSDGNIIEVTPELQEFYDDWRFLTDEQRELMVQLVKQLRSSNR